MPEQELRLHLEGAIPAPPEVLYRALTEPGELEKWWGPAGFEIPSVQSDLRVGGAYRIAMQPPDGALFHLRGEYRALDPPGKVAYTFIWEPPNPDDVETLVELTLRDLGDSTEMVLDQGVFKTEERLELHRSGWSDGYEKLRGLFGPGEGSSG